ncbi:hypothetical protein K435DRAFT_793094 [Dendrothele bispora CBS 962.96]|uniref:Uncharacterized protein n=1 Tax=Dendrothele bispora (strain CBS 962.96) TaxID=1314807 RepID=A0A4S8MGX7_DENBC|nr:hypothetical protein K435DRAFT_793094 [Dendrothele bispora CBS 962.96]
MSSGEEAEVYYDNLRYKPHEIAPEDGYYRGAVSTAFRRYRVYLRTDASQRYILIRLRPLEVRIEGNIAKITGGILPGVSASINSTLSLFNNPMVPLYAPQSFDLEHAVKNAESSRVEREAKAEEDMENGGLDDDLVSSNLLESDSDCAIEPDPLSLKNTAISQYKPISDCDLQ